MRNANDPNPYLRTQVLTARPQELRLMLYDGAIRFARRGREGLGQSDFEQVYEGFSRAKRIVLELNNSLDHAASPELCKRLSGLYTYIYRLLVEGNMHKDLAQIDEAIELLEYERDTWRMLIDKLGSDDSTDADADAAASASTVANGGPQAGPANPYTLDADGSSTISRSA